jgi:hypothetical protein
MKERKYTEIERKADTRMKIMMGGLIKKAELDHLHPEKAEVLYGMLLDCKNRLETDPSTIRPNVKDRAFCRHCLTINKLFYLFFVQIFFYKFLFTSG